MKSARPYLSIAFGLGAAALLLLLPLSAILAQGGSRSSVTPSNPLLAAKSAAPERGPLEEIPAGDVSCDNARNVIDALYVMQYEVGLREPVTGCPLPPATLNITPCDVSGDAMCNVIDALYIMQCDVGIENPLCSEPAVDLAIAKDDGNAIAFAGSAITYTLSYSNAGGLGATGVVVTEAVPANTSFDAAGSSPGWMQVGASDIYTHAVGALAPQATGALTFVVAVDEPVPAGTLWITNTASIGDDGLSGPDAMPGNNLTSINTPFSTGPTSFCGSISTDTTWTSHESPYVVTCDVTVVAGVTLTLEAGTIVKFQPGRSLSVNGELVAQGTSGAPVYITSYLDDSVGGDTNGDGGATSPAPGDWSSIYIGGTDNITLDYTTIRYGGGGCCSNGSLTIVSGVDLVLDHSVVSDGAATGIFVDEASSPVSITLANSTVSNHPEDGIRLSDYGGHVVALNVTDSEISGNNGYGVYGPDPGAYGAYMLEVTGSTISNHVYGIYVERPLTAVISGNTFSGNERSALSLTGRTLSSPVVRPVHMKGYTYGTLDFARSEPKKEPTNHWEINRKLSDSGSQGGTASGILWPTCDFSPLGVI